MAGNPFEEFVQTELPKRPYLPADVNQESIFIRRGLGPRQMAAVQLQEGEVLGMVDGVLAGIVPNTGPAIDAVTHIQPVTSSEWVITHNRNNDNVQVTLYDADGRQFEPDSISLTRNMVTIVLAEPVTGRAVMIFAPQTEEVSFVADERTLAIDAVVVPVVTANNQLASAVAIKPNGALLAGQGNANGGLVSAVNGHLELLIGARLRNVAEAQTADEFGNYALVIGSTHQWSFVQSAALLDVSFGSVLTNFYDIKMKVEDTDNVGEGFELTLTRIGKVYQNLDEAKGIRIYDGAHSAVLSVYQDLKSPSYYQAAFPTAPRNAAGGLLGNFKLTLTATPKAGVAGVAVSCVATVTATGVAVGV